MNDEANWFEPIPDPEGDVVEINEATLQVNITLLKEEKADEEDNNGEEEAE